MRYVNNSKEQRMVSVSRVQRFIQPGETIDLTPLDVRDMKVSSRRHVVIYDSGTAKQPAKAAKTESKKTDTTPAKKKSPEPEVDEKTLRKEIKSNLEEMNKGAILEVAEKHLKIDLKWKDSKGDMIKKSLKAAKEIGYAKVVKKLKV